MGAARYAEGMTVATRRAAALSLEVVGKKWAEFGYALWLRDFSWVGLADGAFIESLLNRQIE